MILEISLRCDVSEIWYGTAEQINPYLRVIEFVSKAPHMDWFLSTIKEIPVILH